MLKWLFQSAKYSPKNNEVQRLLRQHFTQIYALTDQSHCSLLHIAADYNPELLAFLLELYDEYAHNHPPQQHQSNHHLLISKQEWVNSADEEGNTPLHYAVFRNMIKSVKILQRHGANHTLTNHNGLNCLHMAAQGGSPLLIVKHNRQYHYILKGINANSVDHQGSTPLHWAAYAGMEYALTALLALHADPDLRQQGGNTPLHLAAGFGWARIVRKLVLGGCNWELKNNQGQLASDIARQNSHDEIVEMLRDKFRCGDLLLIKSSLIPTTPKQYPSIICIAFTTFTVIPNSLSVGWYQEGFPFAITVISLALWLITAVAYIWARCSNPGRIQKSTQQNNQFLQMLEQFKPKILCFDCKFKKPPRSHHCPLCKYCIKVYDHHCPWLDNCIGSNNALHYLILLASAFLYIVTTIAAHIARMTSTFDYQNLSSADYAHLIMGIVAIVSCLLLFVPVAYLLGRQLVLSARGITILQEFIRGMKNERQQVKLNERKKIGKQPLLDNQPRTRQIELTKTAGKSREQQQTSKEIEELSCWQNWRHIYCVNKVDPRYG